MTPDTKHAEALLAAGFKLCQLHPMSKRPMGDNWNTNLLTAPVAGAAGYGVPLKANALCSIDPDTQPLAEKGLASLGFQLGALMSAGVRTSSTRPGSGGRSTFKDPGGLKWIKFIVKLPDWNLGGKLVPHTALELRATSDNLQDCVPGVVYRTETGEGPYRQTYSNGRTFLDAPALPAEFMAWWRRMSEDHDYLVLQQKLFAEACGGEAQPSYCEGMALAFPSTYRMSYNADHPVEELLAAHGYEQVSPRRWSCPTATGAAGIRPIPGKDGLWRSDHASDPLSGTFDAWAAHVVLDHGGDLRAAEMVEAAAMFDEEPAGVLVAGQKIDPMTTGIISMSDLFHAPKIERPPMVIEGLVTGGLYLLASPPKCGKSRLLTQMSVSWGACVPLFGVLNAAKLKVLYYAAEDTLAEMQERLQAIGIDPGNAVIKPGVMPANLTELELEIVREGAQVVILDTMAHFAPLSEGKANAYDHDTKVYKPLKQLCDRLRVTIICVTHTGKPGRHTGDDPFMEIMGSVGKQGMANGMLVMRRLRTRREDRQRASLFVRARGMAEVEYVLQSSESGVYWELVQEDMNGDPLAGTGGDILEFLREHGPNRPSVLAAALEIGPSTVYRHLAALRSAGVVDHNNRGIYAATNVKLVTDEDS